jgi:hypothetical protein
MSMLAAQETTRSATNWCRKSSALLPLEDSARFAAHLMEELRAIQRHGAT